MTDIPDPDTVGPVDVAVVLFEGNNFNGDVAPAIAELQQNGTVRIIDLAFLTKSADGEAAFVEVEDAGVSDAFAELTESQLDLLSDEDLMAMADGLDPDSSALVVVWENSWASRLASAIRGSGGEVVSYLRIPHETVATAIEALQED
ncbi:MAG TPA: DUF6325 family protein [Actinomycetota bacterium]|jgi:uncharacterized membrane protein|nr:DUF6325 family protein [Actinomycetota bacterium]HNL52674.1 DUF6325 family protein [Actinomycetota bacterium]